MTGKLHDVAQTHFPDNNCQIVGRACFLFAIGKCRRKRLFTDLRLKIQSLKLAVAISIQFGKSESQLSQ